MAGVEALGSAVVITVQPRLVALVGGGARQQLTIYVCDRTYASQMWLEPLTLSAL